MAKDVNFKIPTPLSTRCPVESTVALIGGKWKPYVLFNLLDGSKRFSELKRIIPKVSDRMLTRALRELADDELITRQVIAQVPVKVVYALSADGTSLVPILDQMINWAQNRSPS